MEHPDKLKIVVRVSKSDAAIAQLTAAIVVWFEGGDAVSIHTLAAAAHDCFYWMAKNKGKESILRAWMQSQSKGLQKRIADAQNFFKHGHKWLKRRVKYPVIYGEMLMFDSVVCYGMVFDPASAPAVLSLYAVRFGLENADILKTDLAAYYLPREVIDELRPLRRQEFFERGLALVGERYPHLLDPPELKKP